MLGFYPAYVTEFSYVISYLIPDAFNLLFLLHVLKSGLQQVSMREYLLDIFARVVVDCVVIKEGN